MATPEATATKVAGMITPEPARNPVNSNEINMAECKGTVRPCPYCKKEDILSGRACAWCLSQRYVADCLKCDGTGLNHGRSVWDGGKSSHQSTCNYCGGKGMFPARAKDYAPPVTVAELEAMTGQESRGTSEEIPEATSSLSAIPEAVSPMKNIDIARTSVRTSKATSSSHAKGHK